MRFVPVALVVALLVAVAAAFTVHETEQVIITQFGDPVRGPITESGLHFKLPFVQDVRRFDKRILEWDGDAREIVTKDKKTIFVDTTARWRIKDPLKFLKTANNEASAQSRLDDILDGATRRFISENNLIEAVRASDRELQQEEEIEAFASERSAEDRISVGRDQLIESILSACQADVAELGIELIDVRIRRIDYSAKVRQSVQKRMIAERNQIAERYRSEGTGRAAEIEGEKQKELKRIESESFRKAETIRGEADAEATRIYAESFGADPEFYAFYQTLDTYRQALASGDTTLVLSTESELLKYLKGEQGRAGESK
ncbi:MAG: protease modulator HflC [Planctomycetota bacterium JB042]